MSPPRRLQAGVLAAALLSLPTWTATVDAQADTQGWTIRRQDAAATSGAGKDHDRSIISPRMDFEQWTPLGRGDPLKNDPTFDYLPPVLDKVLYWKSSAPPPPAPAPVHYNRRFFLTEFSRKEPVVQAYAPYKRTVAAAPAVLTVAGPSYRPGYVAWPPKTPLPMLTPPPYQRAAAAVRPVDPLTSFPAGDSTAESKQPPAVVRAPPHPASSHSFIKSLLDAEVDRTTVTTTAVPTTVPMTPTTQPPMTTQPPPTTQPAPPMTTQPPTMTTAESPSFAHYRHQPPPPPPPQQAVIAAAAADRPPMYLIIQGHSKVKTYGPYAANKPDDLQSSSPSVASHDHNHVGHDGPDRGEPSRRRKRGGGPTAAG